jgi:CYTH domain-containing protein
VRTLAQEMADPKYAHIERERRWRVMPGARPALDGLPSLLMEDRYLHDTRIRLRRMTNAQSGEVTVKLTKKYDCADPLARPIVTSYFTAAEYDLIARLPADLLCKRRYTCEGFSLDIFEGALAGLELVEIEADDDGALRDLSPPSWAGREVSHDPRYQGGTLARNGKPEE